MSDKYIGKYTRIEKIIFNDGYESFFLTHDDITEDFEVDMTSDFFFNELDIIKRETVKIVSTLEEVVQFCKEHDINFNNRLEENALYVGGCADMVVNKNLEYCWED